MIHHPHFSSTELHADYVDSLAFHGDLILSKSARENCILLWRICGFMPSFVASGSGDRTTTTPPPSSTAPTAAASHNADTRSAWADGTRDDPAFALLLTLEMPGCDTFYIRFALLPAPHAHPVVAAASERGRVFFWDMDRLEREGVVRPKQSGDASSQASAPRAASASSSRARVASIKREVSSTAASSPTPAPLSALAPAAAGGAGVHPYFGGPFNDLRAHQTTRVQQPGFCGRQCAWSTGGEWCVVVGDAGTVCAFGRWGAGAQGSSRVAKSS